MEWLILVLAVAIVEIGHAWWRRHLSGARQRRVMLLCEHAGLEFAPMELRLDTAWLPFPMFGHPKHGTESVVWDRRLGDDVHTFDLWYVEPADERGSGVRRTLMRRRAVALVVSPPAGRAARRGGRGRAGVRRRGGAAGARGVRPPVPGRDRGRAVRRRVPRPAADGGPPRAPRGRQCRRERGRPTPVGAAAPGGAGARAVRRRRRDPAPDPAGRLEPVPSAARTSNARAPLDAGALESRVHRLVA
jgi:hypothetical protein